MSELKEIAAYLGIEPNEGEELTLDVVKGHVEKNYVPVANIRERRDVIDPLISEALGKAFGPAQTALIAQAKELGIEVKHSDFDGKKLTDIVPDIFGRVKAKFNEFEGKKPDEKLAAEMERLKGEYGTLKTDYSTKLQEFEGYKTQVAQEKNEAAKAIHRSQAFGGVKYKPNMSDFERKGFEAVIGQTYDILIGEDGNGYAIFAFGEKKGSRVPSPQRADKFLTFAEAVSLEAEKAKLIADPRTGAPITGQRQQQAPAQQQAEPQRGKVKMSPRALGL